MQQIAFVDCNLQRDDEVSIEKAIKDVKALIDRADVHVDAAKALKKRSQSYLDSL